MKHKHSWYLNSLLTKNSISRSLTQLFFTVFLIPVVLICTFYVVYLYKSMRDAELEKVISSLEKTESEFNESLVEVKAFSDRLYVNRKIQSLLLKDYSNIQDIYSAYSELSFLEDYLRNYKEIANFRIYVKNETLHENSYIKKATQEDYERSWFKTAVIMKGHAFWHVTYDKKTNKRYLSLVRSLWSPSYRQYIGVLVININPEIIQKNLSEQLYETLIYFEDQNIFTTVKRISKEEIKEIPEIIRNNETNDKYIPWEIQDNQVGLFAADFYPQDSNCVKFKFVYIIPLKQLNVQTRNNICITLFLLLSMILLSSFVFIIYSNYVKNRVTKVQTGIEKVVSNNFEIEESIGGNDEFEKIYNNLYSMSGNLKTLIDEIYQQKIEKEQIKAAQSEMSFKMLASQINPHFLFNTIETIRMKSLASGDKDVSKMLRLLAQLLRYNLSVKGKPVPLSKEIEAINNYLTIQHMRFGDRIEYSINSNFDMEKYEILPLLIQPIVENSFNHGLEDREKGGTITINLEWEKCQIGELISIKVKDNGQGIPEEKLKEISYNLENNLETSKNNSEVSIGLGNVNSRIKLYYKNGSGIEINSSVGQGTEVCLKLYM